MISFKQMFSESPQVHTTDKKKVEQVPVNVLADPDVEAMDKALGVAVKDKTKKASYEDDEDKKQYVKSNTGVHESKGEKENDENEDEEDLDESKASLSPGWMLKKDKELGKKVADKINTHKKIQSYMGKPVLKEEHTIHRVGVTISDPDHPSVSKRKDTEQRTLKMYATSKEHALEKAKVHYKNKGYKVHDTWHISGGLKEDVDQLNEISARALASAASAASDPHNTYDKQHDADKFAQYATKKFGSKIGSQIANAGTASHFPKKYGADGRQVPPQGDDTLAHRTPSRTTAAGKANKQDIRSLKNKIRDSIREDVETIEEGTLDKLSLAQLKDRHAHHHETGRGSSKSYAAMGAIENHVKKKYGAKALADLQSATDAHADGGGYGIAALKSLRENLFGSILSSVIDLHEKFFNHREAGEHGVVHPDFFHKSVKVGDHVDFYDHGTGDKKYGQLVKHDGKQVHIKHDGKIKKYKVASTYPSMDKKED